MKKNYTKPEIEISRYDVAEATMANALSATATLFSTDGSVGEQVGAVKVVSYTEIFGV